MPGVVIRSDESRAVADFLGAIEARPSALVIAGEAGIGKTTLWLGALKEAHERGFRVLSARAGQAESGLAFTVPADLLVGFEPAVLDGLPHLQRVALDRVLLREDGTGPPTDERVVASAFERRAVAEFGTDPPEQRIAELATSGMKNRTAVPVTTRYLVEWYRPNLTRQLIDQMVADLDKATTIVRGERAGSIPERMSIDIDARTF